MLKCNKGFTLVETLIALVLFSIIMLFITQAFVILSETTENADNTVVDSDNTLYVLSDLQQCFMQSTSFRVSDEHIILEAATGEFDIIVNNKQLSINNNTITSLIKGSITVMDAGIYFDLVLPNKSFIQTTFYLGGGEG